MLTDRSDNRFLNALNDIDDDLIEEIAEAPVEPEIVTVIPKKSRFIRFAAPAAALAIVAAVGIGALIIGRNILSPRGGENTVITESEPASNTTEQSNDSTPETAPSQTVETQNTSEDKTDLSPAEIPIEINTDIISELGMNFRQFTEKYGRPIGEAKVYRMYNFGGYGRYVWKSYYGETFDDIESAGGCNYIDGVKPKDLFLGAAFPMNFDELSKQYNLDLISIDSEETSGYYWSIFSCALYDNVQFAFASSTYGSIDETTSCIVLLDVDCTEAKPVITSVFSGTSTQADTDTAIPELVLLDGNIATDDQIISCTAEGAGYLYEVNTAFAFSPDNVITSLSENGKWEDFTVTKADALYYYIQRDGVPEQRYQHLWLKGEISFEAKANYLFGDKNTMQIALAIPEELTQKLPCLNFNNGYNDDNGCRTFILEDFDSELSKKITEKLEAGEAVTVSVTTDEFMLQYTDGGLITDGMMIGLIDNVIDYEIK